MSFVSSQFIKYLSDFDVLYFFLSLKSWGSQENTEKVTRWGGGGESLSLWGLVFLFLLLLEVIRSTKIPLSISLGYR